MLWLSNKKKQENPAITDFDQFLFLIIKVRIDKCSKLMLSGLDFWNILFSLNWVMGEWLIVRPIFPS